jgi:hypothetical protein
MRGVPKQLLRTSRWEPSCTGPRVLREQVEAVRKVRYACFTNVAVWIAYGVVVEARERGLSRRPRRPLVWLPPLIQHFAGVVPRPSPDVRRQTPGCHGSETAVQPKLWAAR